MKIVVSWLREFCAAELPVEDLAELLTHKGAEVESIERPWERLSGVVVSRVVEVRDHPASEKLCLARVQTGSGEVEVVVGVRNMRPGDLVPLAGPGATIPTLDAPLSAREIRGVVSNGMLCSPMELRIGPSHDGILVLPAELEVGRDLKQALGLDDAVLDIEVTPNRPDFLSVIGVAREVSAATGVPFRPPTVSVEEEDEKAEGIATVEIADPDRCPRYLARILRESREIPSPVGVQARLTAAGMRPISAVVDATNYAMLEIGQPLHAFDIALLRGPGIVVRRAADGERLVTLDGLERTLTSDDLLICDVEHAVAVAGVMGGEGTEVSSSTRDILLESASFERAGIQRTRRRIEVSTEASMRFERGTDPEAVSPGADRACHLMQRWAGVRVLAGSVEAGSPPPRRRVRMRASRASGVIGYRVSADDALDVFERLMMPAYVSGEEITVEVPGYRVDIEREIDLIEEVVRVQGYERVGSTVPPVRQIGGLTSGYALLRRIRGSLARAGLREVRLIPFVSEADLRLFGDHDAVGIANPLQAEDAWLRTRLVAGLLKALSRNASRQVRSAAIFEIGTVFRRVEGKVEERPKAALAMTGIADEGWTGGGRPFDVFDAKGALEAMMADLGILWSPGEPLGPPFHPGRSASIIVEGQLAGVLGSLHPSVVERFDLPGETSVAELEVAVLSRRASVSRKTSDVPRFPPIRRDLAFVLPVDAPAGAVQGAIEEAAGDLLGGCVLFDVYEGEPLPAGRKSLAFNVELRALDRTLDAAEAETLVARIIDGVAVRFGGELRR